MRDEIYLGPTSRASLVLNIGIYYAGWLACVLGAANGRWVAGTAAGIAVVIAHLALSTRPGVEVRLIAVVTIIGYAVDSLQTALGLLVFANGQPADWLAPVWIGVMWMLFAETLRYCFRWLADLPLLAALFGLFGGPAAFYAGHRLGAVDFHPTPALSLVALGLVWAALLPTLLAISVRVGGDEAGHYRFLG